MSINQNYLWSETGTTLQFKKKKKLSSEIKTLHLLTAELTYCLCSLILTFTTLAGEQAIMVPWHLVPAHRAQLIKSRLDIWWVLWLKVCTGCCTHKHTVSFTQTQLCNMIRTHCSTMQESTLLICSVTQQNTLFICMQTYSGMHCLLAHKHTAEHTVLASICSKSHSRTNCLFPSATGAWRAITELFTSKLNSSVQTAAINIWHLNISSLSFPTKCVFKFPHVRQVNTNSVFSNKMCLQISSC